MCRAPACFVTTSPARQCHGEGTAGRVRRPADRGRAVRTRRRDRCRPNSADGGKARPRRGAVSSGTRRSPAPRTFRGVVDGSSSGPALTPASRSPLMSTLRRTDAAYGSRRYRPEMPAACWRSSTRLRSTRSFTLPVEAVRVKRRAIRRVTKSGKDRLRHRALMPAAARSLSQPSPRHCSGPACG